MQACPCGRAAAYAACCEPFHRGAEAPDAERLMRSRYAAFALGEVAYLHRTLHPDHPEAATDPRAYAERLRAHLKRARYRGLEVRDARGPDADGVSWVLFRVDAMHAGKDAGFAELSCFAVHDGGHRYVGGRTFAANACPAAIDDAVEGARALTPG